MQAVNQQLLSDLVQATKQEMEEQKYAEATIKVYEKIWRMFSAFAEKSGVNRYSTEFAYGFLKSKFGDMTDFPRTYTQAEYFRGLNKLDEFYKYGFVSSKRPRRKTYTFPEGYDEQIQDYLAKRTADGLSEKRIQTFALYLERFSLFCADIGLMDVTHITNKHINKYLTYAANYTASTVTASIGCLRAFLTHLHDVGAISHSISYLLPKVSRRSENAIPSAFSKDEVECVLKCIDRSSPTGTRNYAMMILASRLGLRASDIRGLTFSNIDWEGNRISFVTKKTGKMSILPLLNEVGDAIIAYLKVRPVSDSNEIFLRANPPFVKLTSSALYWIASSYINRSGIRVPQGKKHGPHSLRHSLSSIMLESSVPLPIISDILTHSSTNTTKVYLKIDVRQLRECALKVPAVHSVGGVV
jgi:site-specific recombinase XerD